MYAHVRRGYLRCYIQVSMNKQFHRSTQGTFGGKQRIVVTASGEEARAIAKKK